MTEAYGAVLSTLDSKPALQLYRDYLGDKARELPASGMLYPLGLVGEGDPAAMQRVMALKLGCIPPPNA